MNPLRQPLRAHGVTRFGLFKAVTDAGSRKQTEFTRHCYFSEPLGVQRFRVLLKYVPVINTDAAVCPYFLCKQCVAD